MDSDKFEPQLTVGDVLVLSSPFGASLFNELFDEVLEL